MENSEFDLIDFFEKTPDLVCIASRDGFFKKVNPAVIEKLGYSKKELFSEPIASFIHPEDKELTSHWRAKLLSGSPLLNFQNRYVTKNGKIVWLEWTSIYFPDKQAVFAIAKDVTEKKLIEKEIEDKYIKYKSLATHFKSSMEEDKRYLAAELHEELAQLASVAKFDIDWMRTNFPDLPATWKNKIEHAFVISEALINTIQRISFSISPKMLDDFGLDAALEWHCKEFEVLSGIPCQFESAYEQDNLSHEVKMDFFRICQESLTNIMRHAHAHNTNVSIKDTGDRIMLSIVDDGIGFIFDQQKNKAGLTRIRERVTSINGQLTIQSEIGVGTKICVAIEK